MEQIPLPRDIRKAGNWKVFFVITEAEYATWKEQNHIFDTAKLQGPVWLGDTIFVHADNTGKIDDLLAALKAKRVICCHPAQARIRYPYLPILGDWTIKTRVWPMANEDRTQKFLGIEACR